MAFVKPCGRVSRDARHQKRIRIDPDEPLELTIDLRVVLWRLRRIPPPFATPRRVGRERHQIDIRRRREGNRIAERVAVVIWQLRGGYVLAVRHLYREVRARTGGTMGDREMVPMPLCERQSAGNEMERVRLVARRQHHVRSPRREIYQLRVGEPERIDARISIKRDTPVRRVAVGGERNLQHGLLLARYVAEARRRTVVETRTHGLPVHKHPRSARRLAHADIHCEKRHCRHRKNADHRCLHNCAHLDFA